MTGYPTASLTVVIPHLNGPDGLRRCLTALAKEREASGIAFDVFVVDNGSKEMPEAVCAEFPFVRLMSEAEPGPGPARSTGASQATSEFLAFIDADCVAWPGWVSQIVSYFRDHPETGVIGGDVRITRTDPNGITPTEAYESVFGYQMKRYVEKYNYTGTGNMAVRREIFEQVGPFAGIHLAEDMDWGRRATAQGVKIDYLPDMVIETPARGTFAELARKWDRHIGPRFRKGRGAGRPRALAGKGPGAGHLANSGNPQDPDLRQGGRRGRALEGLYHDDPRAALPGAAHAGPLFRRRPFQYGRVAQAMSATRIFT